MERQEIKRKKAFTLVELIVVITILGILATIGFIGFKNFLKDARDGNRIMTIKNIENGLKLNYIKSNKYLEPEGEILEGEINGKQLIKVGEFGKENARQININNVIVDPLTKQYYKYGTDARNKYYEIASVLEGEIAYKSILTKTYASSEYKAKVTGNYPGYIKFNSGSELWIANIPSIILNNTGSVELLGTEAYYVVDKGENLPYKINNEIIQKIQSNELIKKITKSQNAILTGVNITGITETNFEEYFSGTILESFNVNKVDVGNIQTLKESVKQIVLGSITTQYNSCATPPNYTDAIFTIGTPNKQNQEWQSISEEIGCYWKCPLGKVLLGNECVSENCSGETPDGTIKVVNATQLLGGTWHYSETDGVCTYKCGENYTENGGNCEPSTRTNQTCTGLIANAVWNSASQITQTWSGSLSEWTPTLTGSYNETTSTTECRYKCSEGFMYDTETSTCKQDIQYSLMFDSAQSQYFSRTPTTTGNRKTWTWSGWVKRSSTNQYQRLFGIGNDQAASPQTSIHFDTDRVGFYNNAGGSLITTARLRDYSSWYHIIVVWNSVDPTSSERVKIYINGVKQIAFDTASYPGTLGIDSDINALVQHRLGVLPTNSVNYFGGYMSEVNFVDGQALSPSDFGQIDATTGQRVPKKYTGTYGTNGFYLDFADGANLGKDKAGTNNWTIHNGITSVNNQVLDHPKNNFATLNPLRNTLFASISNKGNLGFSTDTPTNGGVISTMNLPKSGKWYFEVTFTNNGSKGRVSLCDSDTNSLTSGAGYYGYKGVDGGTYSSAGNGPNLSTYTTNDTIGVAVDRYSGKVWFRKNGNWQGGGTPDPSTGVSPNFSSITYENLCIAFSDEDSITSVSGISNFGQGGQSGLTYYPSAGGYFKYAPPTGFKALSTKNLPEPTIKKPNLYFDVVTYTGNGGVKNITDLKFQPDFSWFKNKDVASQHTLIDSVRGVSKQIFSNLTNPEQTSVTGLSSFNSNGFSLNGNVNPTGDLNQASNNYVAWNWKAGGTAVTNTGGTITSQVSANQTAGFSIVSSVGNGTAGTTMGHGLGKTPDFIIRKSRTSSTGHWYVYHKNQGPTKAGILQLTNAFLNSSAWNNTLPTSSVFSVGSAVDENKSGDNYITYLWSEVPGFSKFGSYTGNGSTDGPFVYTGFTPRWILVKRYDGVENWYLIDTKRAPNNPIQNNTLFPNLSNAESNTVSAEDILSNGFKMRANGNEFNGVGMTYIYAAFAEFPFKYANAR